MFSPPIVPLKPKVSLPSFPKSALPDNVRQYAEYIAKTVQVHDDMPCVIVLSVLSACAQGKARIAVTPEWSEELNLYTAVIAEPGERKSAVFSALTEPVNAYVEQYNELHKAEFADYRNKLKSLETQKNALMGKPDKEQEMNEIQHEILDLEEHPVTPLRLIATDSTPEATASVMAANGGKIAFLADEGVFDVMAGLYTNGKANINIYLNSYDGQPISIDRKTSGSYLLKRPLMTFGVCCQPHVITEFIADRNFIGRGLAQRFLFCQPPSLCGKRTIYNAPIDSGIKDRYAAVVNKLLELPDSDVKMKLSEKAFDRFNSFYNEIEQKIGGEGRYSDTRTFLNKLLGKTARICGLLHLCISTPDEEIKDQTMLWAVSIARYFIQQNEALLADCGDTSIAEYVLERIVKNAKKDKRTEYRARDLKRFCQKYKSADLDEALMLLEEHGYVKFIPDAGKKDRSCGKFQVNERALS